MAERIETDVAIIGAGPAGLFAVFECGMLRMKCVVIDALEAIGGQCAALYPEKPIFDIPAHPSIEGQALINLLEQQAAPFTPAYLLGRRVETLAKQEDGRFLLGTSAGDEILAKSVLIAAGAGAFGPIRPPMEGLESYEASGAVRYLVTRKEEFRGKRLVIAGGGDSAVDWALSLKDVAEKVYFVHRRDKFRAAPETVAQLWAAAEAGQVEMVLPYQLKGLEGDGSTLTGVTVATLKGEERSLPADHLMAFFGLSTELGPIAEWGFGLDRGRIEVNQTTLETSVPGIFAVGDVAVYPGKLKLILQAFSEGAMAAHAIHPIVFPGQALHFEHSTTRGVPG